MTAPSKSHPDDLVNACLGQATNDFFRYAGDRPVLLLHLDEHPEMLPGLYASWQKQSMSPSTQIFADRLGYTTLMNSEIEGVGKLNESATADIVGLLQNALTFAFPLHRQGPDYLGVSFTVGRHPDNDIVLRHGSVSKFHAWFAMEGKRGIRVCAPTTKNGTYVNGALQQGDAAHLLQAGDKLRLGLINATLVQASALWSAFRVLYGD